MVHAASTATVCIMLFVFSVYNSTEGELEAAGSGSLTPRFGQGGATARTKKRDNTRRDGGRS
jgi:hypothetical protein